MPKQVADLTNVVELKSGGVGVCARRDDGTVACWGPASLANPAAPWRDTTQPTTLAKPPARAIAVGWTEACALARDSDEVRCWGSNVNGQLDDGSNPDGPTVNWLL